MNMFQFIEEAIKDGIGAAKADYVRPEEKRHLEGSLQGFEDCKGKTPTELSRLLFEAEKKASEVMFSKDPSDYWYYRCRALEIEWVCNCVSAVLANEGKAALTGYLPTCRGVMKAAEILGRSQ